MNTLGKRTVRGSQERGRTRIDWLDSYHTFSFGAYGAYFDPRFHHFSDLRVINDDRIQPGGGFPTHGHRDMEILTVVLKGELRHQDSLGNGSIIRPGEIQRMTAGSGVMHSEFNASGTESLHLLQIWIHPQEKGLPPGYEQKSFVGDAASVDALEDLSSAAFQCIASPAGEGAAVRIHQDAYLYRASLDAGQRATFDLSSNRAYWVHVATGQVQTEGQILQGGDAVGLTETDALLELTAQAPETQLLLFDLRQP
ncbi:pirin family protein [Vampirovibrio chlorellavorus]|uniref:pirin family protein n=1 Tax=Vampirovibrio chlorellavorus TaxID=758823 RepID=UPI0026EEBC25|nr:pirin family protein [Vampirovibrio chlorellavorus]